MAKKSKRKYSRGAGTEVKREMPPLQARRSKERQGRKGRQGEEPQAGNRHRALQGAQEGQEGPAQEEVGELMR